jgi:transposase
MDLARYLVDAVIIEGRSYRQVAAALGVSKSYVAKVVGRFGEAGTTPDRAALASSPSRAPSHV